MRSTLSPYRSSKNLAAWLLLGASVVVGCSAQSSDSTFAGSPPPIRDDEVPTAPPDALLAEDAATGKSVYRGNPLCRVQANTCMPDDDGTRKTGGVEHCGSSASGGDTDAGGVPDPTEGCRVTKDGAGSVAPSCRPETGAGGDGASCETGADCAVGFDCVVSAAAGGKAKACRHYCCAGNCRTQLSQNGGPTFCDVQRLAEFPLNVPVCMPIKRCEPLSTSQCSANETCAIVSDSGDFGCVTVGDRQVGESCDEDHCAAELTCIGQPGARKCARLCDPTKSTSCGSSQKCMTNPIFKNENVGICQNP
ncbi:MAG: hypothetical protein JST00_32360 [Deltaproteobacteria bacterium]|nr:hypothetical protein [Deltaproteobacteria bacterium]